MKLETGRAYKYFFIFPNFSKKFNIPFNDACRNMV